MREAGEDRYTDRCPDNDNAVIGVLTVGAVVATVLFLALMWWLNRRRGL